MTVGGGAAAAGVAGWPRAGWRESALVGEAGGEAGGDGGRRRCEDDGGVVAT